VAVVFSTRSGYLNVPVAVGPSVESMSNDRICGALGCRNDADGVTPDGKHTCLECADANREKVELYD